MSTSCKRRAIYDMKVPVCFLIGLLSLVIIRGSSFHSGYGFSNIFFGESSKKHSRIQNLLVTTTTQGTPLPWIEIDHCNRRSILQVLLFGVGSLLAKQSARAAGEDLATASSSSTTTFLKGIASLPPGYDPANMSPDAALYVTCRPDRPNNVPQAILDGTRGKAPPVLTARFSNLLEFPYAFDLTSKDITQEGRQSSNNNNSNNVDDEKKWWWQDEDLVVSARLDMDGTAATRSPDDLVGRSVFSQQRNKKNVPVELALTGRGAFGKFATGSSSKK